jgi:hypothetical protein
MVEPITGVAVVTLSVVSYAIGKRRVSGDGEGCNGHHWGESTPAEDVSARCRNHVGLSSDYPYNHYTSRTLPREKKVQLRRKVIKTCKDCGEDKVETESVGTAPFDAFEEKDG